MTSTIGIASDAKARRKLSVPALRAFFRLAELWGLSFEEQLELLGDSISRTTLFDWRRRVGRARKTAAPVLTTDQLTRLSYLMGLYEGLQRIWRRTPQEADAWARRPNAEGPFFGRDPISFMRRGGIPAMALTRSWVDAATEGPPSRMGYPPLSREG